MGTGEKVVLSFVLAFLISIAVMCGIGLHSDIKKSNVEIKLIKLQTEIEQHRFAIEKACPELFDTCTEN